MTLTETGAKILPRAPHPAGERRDRRSRATSTTRCPGKLKVALIPTIGPYLLPLVARQLRKQLPRLKLMLYEHQTQPLLERLRRRYRSRHPRAAGAARRTGGTSCTTRPFTLAVPNDIRWRSAQHQGRRPDGETLLLLEDGHCLRDQALDVCSRIDVQESEDYRATSLETLRQMVAAGPSTRPRPRVRSARCGASPPRAARRSRRSPIRCAWH